MDKLVRKVDKVYLKPKSKSKRKKKLSRADKLNKLSKKRTAQIRSLHKSSGGYSISITIPKKMCVALNLTNEGFLKISRRKENIVLSKVVI